VKILVYPHDLAMGGSQLNAIELAGAVRDLGHDVIVFGRPGVLVERAVDLGLEFVAAPETRQRPGLRVIAVLRRLIRERQLDVLHGYEWPPALDAHIACRGTQAVSVCTVMSMSVAPYIPHRMPLGMSP
jgi:Glycosyltransferase Family 4